MMEEITLLLIINNTNFNIQQYLKPDYLAFA